MTSQKSHFLTANWGVAQVNGHEGQVHRPSHSLRGQKSGHGACGVHFERVFTFQVLFARNPQHERTMERLHVSFSKLLNVFRLNCVLSNRYAFMAWCLVKNKDEGKVKVVPVLLTEHGLDDRGSRVRFPVGAGNFSLHHRVQNSSGAHPASYPMGNRCSFLGGKAAGT
jgi:hypothetical protein